ncbi:MAG: DUF6089 family protein [Bacteroidales bacterium]|nr:DUF6089 family protein [Bacteroidales bacterium]
MCHNKFIKNLIVFFCVIFFTNQFSYAQHRNFDLGIMLGTSQYNGDVNMTKPFYSPQPTIAFLVKKNFNTHYSIRFCATFGNLKADDSDFKHVYQEKRNFYFDNTRIIELSSGIEFNFLEITNEKKAHNFSPYVTFNLGFMYMEDIKWYETFDIPMGLGLKYKISPRFEIRTEWAFRKTFSDKLDQLADQANDGFLQYKQISFNKTKDWFSVAGISLLFNFSEDKLPCHIYEQRKYNNAKKK